MNLLQNKSPSISNSESNSISSSSQTIPNKQVPKLDQRLWRAIDFLHITDMLFSLYTAIIVAILRNELLEQCPLYAKLYLRDNATQFSTDTIDRQITEWGNVYTCEFASFAYLSAFVVSFISLWVHIVFRRVVRTERLLRLPIGLLILIFALTTFAATIIVTDGVIRFCINSQSNICSSSGIDLFAQFRWKIISLPVGGWLTSLSILLNTLVRGIQLFSKPKKSPETLKVLLTQLMAQKRQHKIEKEVSEYGSQISQPIINRNHSGYPTDHIHNREFSPELQPYYHPSIPQYRQIKKRSRFQRICCPCFGRRQRRQNRSFDNPYRPYVVPEEYFQRLNHLKQNGNVPSNLCHHHSIQHPVEQQTQTDTIPQRKNSDESNETPFVRRRRSSVRFEDETPLVKTSNETPVVKTTNEISIPITKETNEQTTSPVVENNLDRNVSFRNNEDDLWTTVTINTPQSIPIQSSHFNRLSIENLSHVNTSISNSDNGVTAIYINSEPTESPSSQMIEKTIPPPPPRPLQKFVKSPKPRYKPPAPQLSFKNTRSRLKPLPPPPPSSRTHTASSEDDIDLRKIKPVEEINTLVANKYNYDDVSQALKSNVERLKSTFINAQENQTIYDTPKNIRSTLQQHSSSDC
ncbi:unnamed protein product [Adineta steineri]|uniref:Uncharacterized protein n=2 Tax=Adineta steineri TaxID=433720 RepID=A0A818VIF0_9BILA|nr:unnamed protein product [Adineta steineri]